MQRRSTTVLFINMSNGRYFVDVVVEWDGVSTNSKCLVDTGAQYTQLPLSVLDTMPDIKLLNGNVKRRGIVPGASRSYSRYVVNLSVEDVRCPNAEILIPNDRGFHMPLLGIDILSRLTLHQLGGSYQLQISSPTFKKNNTHITAETLPGALTAILSERHRSDLYNVIYQSLPIVIDMEYLDLYKLVIKFIREKSL